MAQPLLTIGFPTYNRADILDNALNILLNDPDFDPDKIEVLVSDDASPDHTAQVVAKYPIVKYHRNEVNKKFGNHTVVMSLAKGKYVKLQNDTTIFKPGTLKKMIGQIELADRENLNLYFANPLISLKNGTKIVNNKLEFLDVVSYLIVWSVNTGLWKDDFNKLEKPDKTVNSGMQQVDWLLEVCDMGRKTMIVADDFFYVVDTKNKISYNFYDVFINKYFKILRAHKIKGWAMEKEKYRLLRYFVIPWYFLLKKREYKYDTTNQHRIILKNYWYEPYLLPLMLVGWAKYLYKK
ncbi:MAG: glycosyltransferase family 2 protein [Mucinivorans sp.]